MLAGLEPVRWRKLGAVVGQDPNLNEIINIINQAFLAAGLHCLLHAYCIVHVKGCFLTKSFPQKRRHRNKPLHVQGHGIPVPWLQTGLTWHVFRTKARDLQTPRQLVVARTPWCDGHPFLRCKTRTPRSRPQREYCSGISCFPSLFNQFKSKYHVQVTYVCVRAVATCFAAFGFVESRSIA